jgi:hypothetical protein
LLENSEVLLEPPQRDMVASRTGEDQEEIKAFISHSSVISFALMAGFETM